MQIDVIDIKNGFAKCSLYTGERCVQIVMQEYEYENLIRDGFFIRNGQSKDSAGVLNTSDMYLKVVYEYGTPKLAGN